MDDRVKHAEEFVKDGKLTRRTFIKGVGWITVASALGAAAGCAPQQHEEEQQAEPASSSGIDAAAQAKADATTYSYACCSYNCTSRCLLKGHVRDGRLVAVEPGEMPGRPDYANACLRAMSYIERVQNEDLRVMYPMKRTGERGSGEFERISWEQAMDEIAARMEESKEKYGPESCSFYTFTGNQSKLSMQSPTRFAGCYGATTWDIEGIMGDHGASMGMKMCYGVIRASHDTRDYEQNSNMIVLWGRNLADTHTSELRYIVRARERGAKVVYIDPRFSSTATIADQWIPVKPGSDSALALGMINWIIQNDRHDKDYLSKHSCGSLLVRDDDGTYLRGPDDAYMVWDPAQNTAVPATTEDVDAPIEGAFEAGGVAVKPAFVHLKERAAEYTLERVSELTGLDPQIVETFAREYSEAKPAGIRMGQGMQRTFNTYQSFRTVATLAAVAGYVGVRGGGASHMGGTKANKPVPGETAPEFNFEEWADTGENKANMVKSSLIYQCAVDHDPVRTDFIWFSCSNFLNQSPDAHRIIDEVFPQMSTIVVADPWWTWTAKYAGILGHLRPLAVGVPGEARHRASGREQVRLRDDDHAGRARGSGPLVEQDARGMGAQLAEPREFLVQGLRLRRGAQGGHVGHAHRHLRRGAHRLRGPRLQNGVGPLRVLHRGDGGFRRAGAQAHAAHRGVRPGPGGALPAHAHHLPRPHERALAALRLPGAACRADRAVAAPSPDGRAGARHRARRRGAHL